MDPSAKYFYNIQAKIYARLSATNGHSWKPHPFPWEKKENEIFKELHRKKRELKKTLAPGGLFRVLVPSIRDNANPDVGDINLGLVVLLRPLDQESKTKWVEKLKTQNVRATQRFMQQDLWEALYFDQIVIVWVGFLNSEQKERET